MSFNEQEKRELNEFAKSQTGEELNQEQLDAIAHWIDESCEVITDVIPAKNELYEGHEVWIVRDDGEEDVVHVTLDGKLVEA